MVDMNSYVQELLVTLVESIVEMYELPKAEMSIDMGAELVQIGDKLAVLLKDFVESNQ